MRTLIAIPCMDMVHTIFFKSVLGLQREGEVRFSLSCSSLVYDARNKLCAQAVNENYDRILWLDSDMDFQPDLVIYETVGYYHNAEANEVTPHAVPFKEYPKDSVFNISGCGFGGVLMTVDIAKKVTDQFGVPFAPILGFGEDLSFCLRAEECGGKMVCDSRIKMGHIGLGTITEDAYLGGMK